MSGALICEIPKDIYSKFLKSRNISKQICQRQVTKSCTFVVDLNKLKHPDDVKDKVWDVAIQWIVSFASLALALTFKV